MSAVATDPDLVLPPEVEFLSAARHEMPGYAATEQAARRVRRQVASLPVQPPPFPSIDALAAAAVGGDPVPTDLGEQAWAAERGKEIERLRRLWTEQVATRLENELHSIEVQQADAGLSFLDSQLQAILSAAQAALQVAAGVSTPDAALRASDDQREAFLRLDELTRRLVRLRHAQRELMRTALDYMSDSAEHTDNLLRLTGTVANLPEVLPDWHEVPARVRTRDALTGAAVDPAGILPWRPVSLDNPFTPEIDRDHLVWLCSSKAVGWVPTIAEARATTEALRASVTPAMTEQDEKRNDQLARRVDEMLRRHNSWRSSQDQVDREWTAVRDLFRR